MLDFNNILVASLPLTKHSTWPGRRYSSTHLELIATEFNQTPTEYLSTKYR